MGGGPLGLISGVAQSEYYHHNQALAANQAMCNAASNVRMNDAATNIGAQMQSTLNSGIRGVDTRPSVAQTAASRVQKPEWEIEQDRKDAELDEWREAAQRAVDQSAKDDGQDP